jgi:hypothetical protein
LAAEVVVVIQLLVHPAVAEVAVKNQMVLVNQEQRVKDLTEEPVQSQETVAEAAVVLEQMEQAPVVVMEHQ